VGCEGSTTDIKPKERLNLHDLKKEKKKPVELSRVGDECVEIWVEIRGIIEYRCYTTKT